MSPIRLVRSITAVTFAFCFVAAGMAAGQTGASPKGEKKPEATITLATKPTPPAPGQTTFTVVAKDADGKPITGADVSDTVTVNVDDALLLAASFAVHVTVVAPRANVLPDAGEFVMPPMGAMGEMKNKVALKPSTDPKLAAGGTYVGTGQILMVGKWSVTVDVRVGGKSVAEKKLTVTAK